MKNSLIKNLKHYINFYVVESSRTVLVEDCWEEFLTLLWLFCGLIELIWLRSLCLHFVWITIIEFLSSQKNDFESKQKLKPLKWIEMSKVQKNWCKKYSYLLLNKLINIYLLENNWKFIIHSQNIWSRVFGPFFRYIVLNLLDPFKLLNK